MKKTLITLLSIFLFIFMTMETFASESIVIPNEAAFTFEQADELGILYDKPLHQKSNDELINEKIEFYGGTTDLDINEASTFATTSGVLGYITASGNTYVYSGKGTGTMLGYVTFREIVYISAISGNYAYIQFKNASGVLTYGYIDNNSVYSPAYGWSTPVTSGVITQYYGETITNPSGHTGIDVGGYNGSSPAVYATFSGSAYFCETTRSYANGVKIFADYGQYVNLTSGSYQVYYAHLKSFGQSVISNSYASEGYPVSDEISKLPKTTIQVAAKSVNQGSILGYVGTTGQSSGIHLHFEIRYNNVCRDPFTYVVFPNVSWAK